LINIPLAMNECKEMKFPAAYANIATDVATDEIRLRLVQSVPSPKAEPIKLWHAKVGYARMQELADQTGKSVVSGDSFLPSAAKKTLKTLPTPCR
jgi:hypothetical protein